MWNISLKKICTKVCSGWLHSQSLLYLILITCVSSKFWFLSTRYQSHLSPLQTVALTNNTAALIPQLRSTLWRLILYAHAFSWSLEMLWVIVVRVWYNSLDCGKCQRGARMASMSSSSLASLWLSLRNQNYIPDTRARCTNVHVKQQWAGW